MKDERVAFFRKALEGLLESLDATVRVTRWSGAEVIPDPLQESAGRLVNRLGTADRLATSQFKGSIADVARVNAMTEAMRRLDTAYVAFRHRLEVKPGDSDVAALALHAELDEVKADARSWG